MRKGKSFGRDLRMVRIALGSAEEGERGGC